MNPPSKDALRRGWCPSTLRPMETGDGWLVRLHPPGARLSPAQLQRIAALTREHGNIGDERLMLMAALVVADELFDARADVDELLQGPSEKADSTEPAATRRTAFG